jgi:hypothetical protein
MSQNRPPMKKTAVLISILLGAFVSGCGSTTYSSQTPQSSGFLASYGQLRPMPGRPQALFYENANAKWDEYTQILIEPVRISSNRDGNLMSMSLRDRRMLGSYFEYAMRDAVSGKYHVVSEPGPGVLRVRSAITSASSKESLMSVLSAINGATGEVTMEGEIVDSVSGDRLVAVVDGKAGTMFQSYTDWNDLTHAFDQWAEQLYMVLHKNLGDIPLDTTSHSVQVAAAEPQVIIKEKIVEKIVYRDVPVAVEEEPEPDIAPIVKRAKPKAKPKPVVKKAVAKPKPKAVAKKKPVVSKPVVVAKAPPPAPKPVAKPTPAPKPKSFDPWNGKAGTGSANIHESSMRPFVLGIKTSGSIADVAKAAEKRLKSNGFEVVGQYSPNGKTTIIVVTNSALKKHATASEMGGFGAAIRVSVTNAGGSVQVSYVNPDYMNGIYRMKGSLSAVGDSLAKALGKQQTFGSKNGLSDDDLRDWHYMFGMPYFDDPIELASHSSYKAAVAKVNANLAAGKGGLKKVYQIDLPGKNETVFGIAISSGKGADNTVISAIDTNSNKQVGHLPYEIVVVDDEIYTLNGKFRIALSFPDLTMGQFMKISDAPDAISASLKNAAE